jgi:hypothetical protein
MTLYFSAPANQKEFSNFLKKIEALPDPSQRPNPVPHLIQLFKVFLNNTEKFDEFCESNIGWVGQGLLNRVSNFKSDDLAANDNLLEIFSLAYRFLLELELFQPGNLSVELEEVKRWIKSELDQFPEHIRQNLIWANYIMPAQIIKAFIHHPNIELLREFNVVTKSAEKLRDDWTKEIEAKSQIVERLKQDLDKYETAYNFVGLVDGFKKLLKDKHMERDIAFFSLFLIGCLILLPLILEIDIIFKNIKSLDSIKSLALYLLPPTIALEIFIFYFFRIVLLHFRTVKAHILQLELRVSLCQFIQSYAKYASEIKKSDSASLEKFESLIFSGIVSTEEKLPSTFDGVDQLSNLVKAVQGK